MSLIKTEKGYFQLYSCCIPVTGYTRTIICDLQRGDFIVVPSKFYDIINNEMPFYTLQDASEILYQDKKNIILEQLLEILIEKEYGFISEDPKSFPKLASEVHRPSLISNAIIDIQDDIKFNVQEFINDLSALCCQAVLIRVYNSLPLDTLTSLLKKFENSTIRFIELLLPYDSFTDDILEVEKYFRSYPRCQKITIYGTKDLNKEYIGDNNNIVYTTYYYESAACCGFVSPYYFKVNNTFFAEAQKFNSCLNKKISIDINGRIKNCPAFEKDYGHYDSIRNLTTTLGNTDFTDIWNINKDQISICKDCEFRFICHDCRAFTIDNDLFSKPSKCKYDPYQAVWS